MKILSPKLLVLFTFILGNVNAQDCSVATAQIDFETPRVKVRHHPTGDLWWDGFDGKFTVNDPTLSSNAVSAVFAASLWIGAIDPAANLKLAGNTYGLTQGSSDWYPGPLNDQGQIDSDLCNKFDRFWVIKSEDINAFEMDLADNGMIDNTVHQSILAWPGKDNPHSSNTNGFELPAGRVLAPFIDHNDDNIYNPEDGDRPDIKGANLAHWWIFNDNGNVHTSTFADALGIDVGVLAYSYDDNPFSTSTIFYEYQIANRSFESLNSMHVGLWLDNDLGCYDDDFIGCVPSENLAFAYNQDAEDGSNGNQCFGVNTFESGIPLFGIKVLEGTKSDLGDDNGMSSFIYYNGQSGNPPPGTTDPNSAPEVYNYLRGLWRDGTPITVGGDGYDPSSTDVTSFAYPDLPNSNTGWSMCSTATSPQDRRMVIGSGETTLNPGQITKFAFAAILTEKVEHPCPDITPLITAGQNAQDVYDMVPSSVVNNSKTNFSIQPNPASDIVFLETSDLGIIKHLNVYDIRGQLLQSWTQINESKFQFNVDQLSSGMYLVKIQMANGGQGVRRLVVR